MAWIYWDIWASYLLWLALAYYHLRHEKNKTRSITDYSMLNKQQCLRSGSCWKEERRKKNFYLKKHLLSIFSIVDFFVSLTHSSVYETISAVIRCLLFILDINIFLLIFRCCCCCCCFCFSSFTYYCVIPQPDTWCWLWKNTFYGYFLQRV